MDESTPPAPAPAPTAAANDPCPHCGQPLGDAWLVCAWCGEQVAAPAELPSGALLSEGRYQVLGVIGRGGFGITYEAGDTRLKRRVAIKELFPDAAVRHGSMVLTPPHARAAFTSSRERFLREARVLARFTHPGVVRVYEVFEEHGTAYLVMERLSGRTLVDILRARSAPFTEEEVIDVAARVAAALRPVHAAGVLHRDINPSNVMLTEHGRVVLIDFGLARDFDQDQTMGMTRMVTPGYAPPEQYRGEARFGPSTDVYGLAATCYRLATGRVPVAALERDAGAGLPSPHRVNPAISKAVSDALLDGLELEPSHRPQDLDSFLSRMGIRWLPDGPRSVLLGTVGATPEDLASPGAPEPLPELADPGPVVPVAGAGLVVGPEMASDAVVAGDAAVSSDAVAAVPRSQLPTDASPASPTPPDPEPEAAGPPSTTPYAAVLDADATAVPHRAEAFDPDRTHLPGQEDQRLADGWAPAPPSPPAALDQASRPAGRAKVTVPLFVLAVAAGSAAPVLVVAAVVLVVLPVLATIGDGVAHRRRAARLEPAGWAELHLPAPVFAVARYARNLGMALLRTSPIVGLAALALLTWYALDQTSLSQGVVDLLLRFVGGGAVAALLLTSREGSPRFRSGLGIDHVAERAAPGGRITERLVVSWIVITLIVAIALWLSPDAFPVG